MFAPRKKFQGGKTHFVSQGEEGELFNGKSDLYLLIHQRM